MGSIYNRSTLLSRISALINRSTPFNAEPLVQKTEDQLIREDVVESMLTREADTFSISNPSSTVAVDFSSGQVCNINSAAAIPTSFAITISNLRANEFGKIVVTKKTGDVFSFSNGTVLNPSTQAGTVTISFIVFYTGSTYVIFQLLQIKATQLISNSSSSFSELKKKVIEIGAWDMDSSASRDITHGVSNAANIRSVEVVIQSDIGSIFDFKNPVILGGFEENMQASISWGSSSAVITLRRLDSGYYDSLNFDDTSINRGWLTITYEE